MADAEAASGRDLVRIVLASVAAGATIVQLRAKNLSTLEFLLLGRELVVRLRPLRVPLIINDRVDIALACQASGVHLGQDDLPLRDARRLLGRRRTIGLSVSSVEEARKAQTQGADYLGVGPVYPTASKKTNLKPIGIGGLQAIRSVVKIPVLAIGGISTKNAADIIQAGADGAAVISAILAAPNASRATADLLAALGPKRPRR